MCIIGQLKASAPQPLPPAVAPPPTQVDQSVLDARSSARQRAASVLGRPQTIFDSGVGLLNDTNQAKTLLGQ